MARPTWAPPDTSGYTVLNVPASGPGTNGRYQPTLTAGTDYLVVFPDDEKRVGNVTLSGGRNIVIIGGEIEIVDLSTITEADQDKRCLYLLNQTGHVHIEGVHFHRNASDDDFDCLFISDTSSPTIQSITVQNCLMEGIKGTSGGWHGDGIQTLSSGVFGGTMRLDLVTIKTDYQAYYNIDDGEDSTAIFKRVNVVVEGSQGAALWFGDNGTDPYSYKTVQLLDGVYLDPGPDTFLSEVRPNDGSADADQQPAVNSGVMTWPNSNFITGSLNEGTPPGGDYVTSSIAGFSYTSPGYGAGRRVPVSHERGRPLGGEVLTLSDTTDEAHEIPWDTWKNITKVGIVADADVYVDIDRSDTPRADLDTTGVLVVGSDPPLEVVFCLRGAGVSHKDTVLHIAAASTAGVHLNWYGS